MDRRVFSKEDRTGHGAAVAREGWLGSKGRWYAVWAGMAVVAAVGEMVAANGPLAWSIVAGRCGLFLGMLLGVAAGLQLMRGVDFLSRREVVLSWVVLICFSFAVFGRWLMSGPVAGAGIDFESYYKAARLVVGQTGDLYRVPLFPDGRIDLVTTPFIYPPIFAVLMRPFTMLPMSSAYFVWNCVDVVLILLSCMIGLRLAGRIMSAAVALIVFVGVFSFYPVIHELHLGQVGGWVLFLWTCSVWLVARRWVWLSTFCFAVATMIKLTPLIAVPLLMIHRKWKWLGAYVGWLVVLLGFSVWQVGWAAQLEFVRKVLPSLSCGAPVFQNTSIVSWVQELFLGRVFRVETVPSVISPMICTASKVVGLVVYGLLLFRFYRYRDERNLVRQLVLAMLVSLLVSPISWWQHYVIALLPFLYLWNDEAENRMDLMLLITVLIIGTNIAGFGTILLSDHWLQLLTAGIVACLTSALVYFGASGERLERGDPGIAKQDRRGGGNCRRG